MAFLPPVPAKYKTLIQILQKHLRANVSLPKRSLVSLELGQVDRDAYELAGVSGWRQYADAAEQDGIVGLGGWGGYAWISLMPEWHDRAV